MAYGAEWFAAREGQEVLAELPLEVAHIWGWFQRLAARRQSGMTANPITYTEFQAFCWARCGLRPTAWEIDAFMQLDSHVLKEDGARRRRATPGKPGAPTPIPVTDRGGVRTFMRSLMARKAVEKAQK